MKPFVKMLAALSGSMLLLVLVVVGIMFRTYDKVEQSAQERQHYVVAIIHANELMAALVDVETGERGYLLTGDEVFLEPFKRAHKDIGNKLNELKRMTILAPARQHLEASIPRINALLEYLLRNIELRRQNDMTSVLSGVRTFQGKALMDSVRSGISAYLQIEQNALYLSQSEIRSDMRHMFMVIIIVCVLMVAFAFVLIGLTYRESQQRIKDSLAMATQDLLENQKIINIKLQQANDSLQISEERFDVTLNSIGDAVMATDVEGRVTLLNPLAERLTGWSQAEAAGRLMEDVFDIININTRKSAIIPIKQALAMGTTQNMASDMALVARDGSECPIADSCAPICNREGKIVGAVLVFRDISLRLDVENGLEKARLDLERIKTSEDAAREYAESIINTVREPLITLDHDLRVVSVSRSFYDVFKVKPEETVGQLIYDLGNKQWDIPKLRELLENILPQKASFNNYEVEHDFSTIGHRIMLLNARQIQRVQGKERTILLAIEDITVRREIENGLEKARLDLETTKISEDAAREYAESIINTVREPLITLDHDLRVVSVSRSFYDVFKVKPEETVGQLIYDLGNKQWDIPKLRELLENILPLKASFNNYEVEHDFSNIGRRIMLLNARQIEMVQGKERVILLAIEDITVRREIENGLEKARLDLERTKIAEDAAREYAESIINTVREPLITLDHDLRVVSVSRSFYDVFKVKPEETVGQLIYDLGNKQWDIPKLRELLENILPQKASFNNYEVEHDFSNIGRRIMLLNARQIEMAKGKERVILLAIEDITVRREIENGLEKARLDLETTKISEDAAREYAESIINTVREPLITLDHDLRVVSVSRSFYDLFKVNPQETVGQLIYDLGNKQWDIPKLRELLENILPQQASFNNYEVEHDFSTIGRRIMLLNARQIQRVQGKERVILLAIEDITVRREIENGLGKAHDELEVLAAELKRLARVKAEFLANMSHELRTPLNSINGFSEVLFDETFGPLNEKQKKYVNNVLTSGKHLLLLINQILDMAKVEAGKMTLALTILPTRTLLNELSMLIADMVTKKKIELLVEMPVNLPEIEADELKVKQIIYNLLSNAVKFTPEGGKIGMRAKKLNGEIEIQVWDSGVGIAAENMEKIFEGFFRVDTPYSRITEGTGLGLPLSKKLVELHGGKFIVESAGLDKGTLVRFTLPIAHKKAV